MQNRHAGHPIRVPGKRLAGFDPPGIAAAQELGEVADATFGLDVADLLVDDVFVARKIVPGAEDADGSWEAFAMLHVGEKECVGGARVMGVVDDEVGFGDAVAQLDDFDVAIGLAANAFVAILAEDERLAVFELDDVFAASVFFGDAGPGTVIENVAVLQDFDEGGAFVGGGVFERVFEVGLEDVHGARDESGFGADGQRDRIEGAIERTVGSGLGFFAHFGSWGILAFGQPVDAIVEEENFQADVAAEHVNGVIAADGEGVTVASGDPDFEVGANGFESGGYGGRAAVDGVEAEGVHVIREAGGAADAGDDDEVFALDAEVGEDGLDGGEDGVVAAAGAPADFLVGLEVFFG